MKQGRKRFISTLKKQEQDIFYAAELMSDIPTLDTIKWWDDIVAIARTITDKEKMEQARKAEKLSFDFELQYLKTINSSLFPLWKGLDDNYAGYDILSFELKNGHIQNKLIEVKSTTTSPKRFIITRHEWDTATKYTSSYVFHIWDMDVNPPHLHIRTINDVMPHIPQDNKKGKWSQALIPLGC